MLYLISATILVVITKAMLEIRQFRKNIQEVLDGISATIDTIDNVSSNPPHMGLSINKYLANFKQELNTVVDDYATEHVESAEKLQDTVGEILVIRQTFQLRALEVISTLNQYKSNLIGTTRILASIAVPSTNNTAVIISEINKAIVIKKK